MDFICGGCGVAVRPDAGQPLPAVCPNRGDDGDHVLARVLSGHPRPADNAHPFLRFAPFMAASQLDPGGYERAVLSLDEAVQRVDGRGFVQTPFCRHPLGEKLGIELWVKDETGAVGGSHKARHLFGILVWLSVVEERGWLPKNRELAIASCGNAALAAAILARAAQRSLRVFIPTDAAASVVQRLGDLGAIVEVCPRVPGEDGDPCYRRFREAVERGALPFCCQGPDNGLNLEGGQTLGYEMGFSLAEAGADLDHLIVQVGGGALASSTAQAFAELHRLGVVSRMPALHCVQTTGAAPLARAFAKVRGPADLERAAADRPSFMWPWEEQPRSLAHGILDDETYDWLALVRAMHQTGGSTPVIDDVLLEEARGLVDGVSYTGLAGLAGLLHLLREGGISPGQRVAVLFTGVRR